MNYPKLLAFFLVILLMPLAIAQKTILVQGNERTLLFSDLKTAVDSAISGDTLYLPGGVFSLPGELIINKTLQIIGSGHYPAFTEATGVTKITCNIALVNDAGNTSLSGIYMTGNVRIGTNSENQNVSGVRITRCYIAGALILCHDQNSVKGSNFLIEENFIDQLNGQYTTSSLIQKNLIRRLYYFNQDNHFRNNIIFNTSEYFNWGYSNINECVFENNIFINLQYSTNLEAGGLRNCIFRNNLFVKAAMFGASNSDINNLVSQDINSIFINYDLSGTFSYEHDYNLKEGCAGINFGTDLKDVGLYGTTRPYKEGAVPFIPWINEKTITDETDGEGMLNIKITVNAENE